MGSWRFRASGLGLQVNRFGSNSNDFCPIATTETGAATEIIHHVDPRLIDPRYKEDRVFISRSTAMGLTGSQLTLVLMSILGRIMKHHTPRPKVIVATAKAAAQAVTNKKTDGYSGRNASQSIQDNHAGRPEKATQNKKTEMTGRRLS